MTTVIVDDATRREFLALLGASGLLTACSAAPEPSGPVTVTVTVTTPAGPVDVPRDPQRVVAIEGRSDLDIALTLGWPLVGTGNFGSDEAGRVSEAYRGAVPADVQVLAGELDLETVAALRPDLLVVPSSTAELYPVRELTAIAPLLGVPYGDFTWRADLVRLAGVLDRAQSVAAAVAGYDTALAGLQAALQDTEVGTVAFLAVNADGSVAVVGSSLPVVTALDAGITVFGSPGPDAEPVTLSKERFGELADVSAFYLTTPPGRPAELLLDVATFTRPANAGRVIVSDNSLQSGSALAATAAIGRLARLADLPPLPRTR